MKLSVVILNYNVRYFLELCLKSVQKAITDIDAEIIVVDNNSKDDSCKMMKTLFPNVKLIENKKNFGFSKGNNIGVAQAHGDYLCILNPDTVVAEDAFKKLLDFCETKEKVGAVGCKLIDGTGRFLPESKRNIPTVGVSLKKLMGYSNAYYNNHLGEDETGRTDVLVGAFMFLKKQLYLDIGGFDEDYFMYGEDIDLSYRILKAGCQNYYFGDVTVLHFKGESTLRDKEYAKRFYGAMQIFYKKHFSKNLLFDVLVWLGIKIVPLFGRNQSKKTENPFQYVLVSDAAIERLEAALPKQLIVKNKVTNFEEGTELIFNSNYMEFKAIISVMNANADKKEWTYKILPENAAFILGSDSALGRGKVISFN